MVINLLTDLQWAYHDYHHQCSRHQYIKPIGSPYDDHSRQNIDKNKHTHVFAVRKN